MVFIAVYLGMLYACLKFPRFQVRVEVPVWWCEEACSNGFEWLTGRGRQSFRWVLLGISLALCGVRFGLYWNDAATFLKKTGELLSLGLQFALVVTATMQGPHRRSAGAVLPLARATALAPMMGIVLEMPVTVLLFRETAPRQLLVDVAMAMFWFSEYVNWADHRNRNRKKRRETLPERLKELFSQFEPKVAPQEG